VREKVDGDKPDDKEDDGVDIPRHMMENGLEIKVGEDGEGGDGDVGGREGFLIINPVEGSGKAEDKVNVLSYLSAFQMINLQLRRLSK
jgi:hypothetical protein